MPAHDQLDQSRDEKLSQHHEEPFVAMASLSTLNLLTKYETTRYTQYPKSPYQFMIQAEKYPKIWKRKPGNKKPSLEHRSYSSHS